MSQFMEWFTTTVISKMENRLKLYLVSVLDDTEVNYIYYDDVIEFVVACYSEKEARFTNPPGGVTAGWVKPEHRHLVTVRHIGYAADDVKAGEILIRDILEG
jgi:hypothetical protein